MKSAQTSPKKLTSLNENLQELFDFATPNSLRKSLHHVFFNYLLELKDVPPEDFNTIVSDFYFLIMFLQNAEDILEDKVQT